MATETTLKCGACGHENEPERVYCHSCGQKLDRSLLPKQEQKKVDEDLGKRRREVAKMMSAGRGNIGREIKTGVSVLLLAAAVAAVFLFWQKPDGTPSEKQETLPDRDAGDLLAKLIETPLAATVTLSEIEVNDYLRRAIKPAGGTIPGVEFKRAFVRMQPGVITFTVQRDAWGLGMYTSMSYSTSKDGAFSPEVVGMRFGKLGLHPLLKPVGNFSVSGVTKAFEKDLAGLARLADVRVNEGSITLTTKASQ